MKEIFLPLFLDRWRLLMAALHHNILNCLFAQIIGRLDLCELWWIDMNAANYFYKTKVKQNAKLFLGVMSGQQKIISELVW